MISVSVPCSCGEFIQGKIGIDDALISCPIDIYSTAIIKRGKQTTKLLEKVQKAIEATINYYDVDKEVLSDLSIDINTSLPYGKGYATSTSEMVAVIVAISKYLKKEITPIEVAQICVAIEPTDSIMFKGIALFKHLKCELLDSVDLKIPYNIAILELAESISTVGLREQGAFKIDTRDSTDIFKTFLLGISNKKIDYIRNSMLSSALGNQNILEKKFIKEINEMAILDNAIGINVAHSGSIVGVMFECEKNMEKFIEKFRTSTYSKLYCKIRKTKVVSGGWIINSDSGGSNGFNN